MTIKLIGRLWDVNRLALLFENALGCSFVRRRDISPAKGPKLRASKLFAQITTGNRAQLGRSLTFTVPSPCWFTLRKKNQRQFSFLYQLFALLIPCNLFTLFVGNFSCIYKRNALNWPITSTYLCAFTTPNVKFSSLEFHYIIELLLTDYSKHMEIENSATRKRTLRSRLSSIFTLLWPLQTIESIFLPSWLITITFRILRIHKISITLTIPRLNVNHDEVQTSSHVGQSGSRNSGNFFGGIRNHTFSSSTQNHW